MNSSQITRQQPADAGFSARLALLACLMSLGVPCAAQTVPAESQATGAASSPPVATRPSAPGPVPSMPPTPSFANLDSKRPVCKYDISRLDIPKMEDCRASWETYRIIELEGYNSALKEYISVLKRLDKKLLRQTTRNEISPELYEDYKEEISDHIQSASIKDGFLLNKYYVFFEVYKNGVKAVQAHYRKVRKSGGF